MNQYLPNNIEILQKRIEEELFFIEKMKKEASKVIVGQENLWDRLMIALVSGRSYSFRRSARSCKNTCHQNNGENNRCKI